MKISKIRKSPRHSKIIGDFGELKICNWLSRSGFEIALVDHTGIDIVAYDKESGQRLGITVKSRTRCKGSECISVNLLSNRKSDRIKIQEACRAFGCVPWIGIYVETENEAYIYLTSLKNYEDKYMMKNKAVDDWKMSKDYIEKYAKDPEVRHVKFKFDNNKWW